MDIMEIRRKVLMAMAKGAGIIKGTFTAVNQGNNTFTLNFGKTFSQYIYLIKMTDESLQTLMASGQTSAKMYECLGKYPEYEIMTNPETGNAFLSFRAKPSDNTLSISSSESGQLTESSITLTCNTYGGGANILYRDYEYEYMIIPIE